MKIVLYSSLFFTDCDLPMIRSLQEKGVEVLYVISIVEGKQCGGLFNLNKHKFSPGVYKADTLSEFSQFKSYTDISNFYIVYRNRSFKNVRNWIAFADMCKIIRKYNPDYVHTELELGLSECFIYFFWKKLVATVHDPFTHSGEEAGASELKRKLMFKLSRKLILLNEKQKEEFISTYAVNKQKVFLNRLGVYDCLIFLSSRNSTNSFTNNYILFFGHFSPYKGIKYLCDAMQTVNKVLPDLKCVIAGKGDLDFDFTNYADNQILLINRFVEINELANYISNCMFVVCPYIDATQSGVVSSAFALSKPVLATNVGGLSESVINGITGMLVKPASSEELASAIIRMASNRDELKEMSQNIKQIFFEGSKSWDGIANKYIDIYNA